MYASLISMCVEREWVFVLLVMMGFGVDVVGVGLVSIIDEIVLVFPTSAAQKRAGTTR